MEDELVDGHRTKPGGPTAKSDEPLVAGMGPLITTRQPTPDAWPTPAGRLKPAAAIAPTETGIAPTLAGADWLDTIIDELLESSTKRIEAKARSPLVAPPSLVKHTEFTDLSIGRAASAVLGQVMLGYSPIIEQSQGVIGTRLTVVPVNAMKSIDAGALLEALADVWPSDGGIVSLNVASETLLRDLLRARPTANVMIEVPAFVAADPSQHRLVGPVGRSRHRPAA